MAIVTTNNIVEQIGVIAGDIWRLLDESGEMPLTKVSKHINAPKDVVMQAIGWLAREDKIVIEEDRRKKLIALR